MDNCLVLVGDDIGAAEMVGMHVTHGGAAIIDAADHDTFLYGLAADALAEKLFESGGLTAKLSGGGLIVRQLIARLGGLGGARPFKIPGVRRLLKTYGPRDAFTMKAALQLIAQGVRRFVWDDDDPLGDSFLLQYGAYPDPKDIGINYGDILSQATLPIECSYQGATVQRDVAHYAPKSGDKVATLGREE